MARTVLPTTDEEHEAMKRKIPISGPTGLVSMGDTRVLDDLTQGYVPFEEQDLESDDIDEMGNAIPESTKEKSK